MNKVVLMGRLTRDPDVRYGQGQNQTAYARYTLAVERRRTRDGEQSADFISCVVFGKGAEFTEKYLHKGSKITISGRIQTGSYTNRENQKVYTTDVIVEEQEFAEPRSDSQPQTGTQQGYQPTTGYMPAPQGFTTAQSATQAPVPPQQTGYIPAPMGGYQGMPQPAAPAQNVAPTPTPTPAPASAQQNPAPQQATYGGFTPANVQPPQQESSAQQSAAPQQAAYGGYSPAQNNNAQAGYTPAPNPVPQGGFTPAQQPQNAPGYDDGFMNIPDGIDEELPFA